MSHPLSPDGGQSIDLFPGDLDSVAVKFATGQTQLDTIATTLNDALQGDGGMAGDDEYGRKFGHSYDPAAKSLFHAVSAAARAIGQSADALLTTANNYLKADHHSNPKAGKGAPKLFPPLGVFTDVVYPDPPSAIGAGHSSVPTVIAKYWPNGHQDRLRNAAGAYRTASKAIQGLGRSLHGQVQSLTDNNSDDSVHAMAAFWAKIWQDGAGATKAPLSAAHHACDQLAKACEAFAHAIDQAHSSTEHKLAGAGILVGLTTAVGVLLTPFTGGGSDAGAAALDGAEAGAILGGVEVAAEEAVADIGTSVIADVGADLDAAATAVPEIETVDAETTEVGETLDDELAQTAARDGDRFTWEPDESDSPGRIAQLRGDAYEKYVQGRLGGKEPFSTGGRQFDGAFDGEEGQETWYEAKSGQYWERANESPATMAKFKSNLGAARRIATENGKGFEVVSENPIPENVKAWLIKKGYTWRIIP
ncbi:WXG100-like domain-containing protein [Streptomyces montanisoli]|uniref:Outer membrane channel protein CpnT-like N-terminal domain-containing protein n=1 Tax=Streptomyces montanisoli TaxID=2798581 RepID=A0A940MCV4_9ACTN|nr:hypothetical protein [Streptomyces montanisoli]MBP0456363.1 hypothetical protein [Streptomyces montanisoli]